MPFETRQSSCGISFLSIHLPACHRHSNKGLIKTKYYKKKIIQQKNKQGGPIIKDFSPHLSFSHIVLDILSRRYTTGTTIPKKFAKFTEPKKPVRERIEQLLIQNLEQCLKSSLSIIQRSTLQCSSVSGVVR